MTQPELIALAKQIATQHGLDPALVCAVCEQESSWNPWAIRYEPAFFDKYVAPTVPIPQGTEARARAFSWGLMQLMGEVARELGYTENLAKLCDPATGLEWGCRHFKNKLNSTGGDVPKALLRWNGGGNPAYPSQVLARTGKYQ